MFQYNSPAQKNLSSSNEETFLGNQKVHILSDWSARRLLKKSLEWYK